MEDIRDGPNTEDLLAGVTDRFSFVDGNPEGLDFFAEPFIFPWLTDQPNDFGEDEDCVR